LILNDLVLRATFSISFTCYAGEGKRLGDKGSNPLIIIYVLL